MQKSTQKMLKKVLLVALFAIAVQFTLNAVMAQSLPVPDVSQYRGSVQNPGTVQSFDLGLASLVVGIVMNVRYILIAIAIAGVIFAGFEMVTAQGNDEKWTRAKNVMTWSIVGLGIVGLSGDLVRIFAVGRCAELGMLPATNNITCVPGGFLKDPASIIQRTSLFNETVQYIITFIKYLIGAVAVVMLMRNAIRMASNVGGEELEKDKKNLIATIVGLIVIIIADPIINDVLFSIDTSRYPSLDGPEAGINVAQGVREVVGFTNFLVTILTPIAILTLVAGGFMYITAGGDGEKQGKAKRVIFMALLGIVIIYGAFAIVSTFLRGQFDTSATIDQAGITQTEDV